MTIRSRHSRVAGKPVAAPRTFGRIIGLDGARGLSCLGVAIAHIAGHYSPQASAETKIGLVGTTLIFFYVLSGFLLFLPYIRGLYEDRDTARLPNTKNFVVHRIARILPGYLAIFLLVNFVFQVSYVQNASLQPPGTDAGTGMITDPWQLAANLTLTQSYVPKFFQTGINPAWSLTLEYAFYASLPLLGLLMYALLRRTRLSPTRIAIIPPLLLIVLGFVAKLFVPALIAHFGITSDVLLNWGPNWVAVFLRSFLANADNFAFGMLAAVVIVLMEKHLLREGLSRRVRLYSTIALLPTAVAFVGAFLVAGGQYQTSAVAIGAALLILIMVAPLARGQDSGIARVLDTAPMRFVGKVSLSAYLWHFPVLLLLGRWGLMAGDTVGGMVRNLVVALAATMAISTVTYYLVERPAIQITRKYRHRWAS
ncbi:acyltransferase [Mycolicibacterium madagascariense]|uniref:Acyltransferase n=1 Tax=Mycolicibacterium madagascariense TaxID=212765 RepID=A0A7I7XBZ8_9MYCO|nr:acyltransferase [Mycolicibacterium madagascariense]BBZ27166.1 acyltransferase [Mycolicibacterium madagascariense]